jgi:hypothetical protein
VIGDSGQLRKEKETGIHQQTTFRFVRLDFILCSGGGGAAVGASATLPDIFFGLLCCFSFRFGRACRSLCHFALVGLINCSTGYSLLFVSSSERSFFSVVLLLQLATVLGEVTPICVHNGTWSGLGEETKTKDLLTINFFFFFFF